MKFRERERERERERRQREAGPWKVIWNTRITIDFIKTQSWSWNRIDLLKNVEMVCQSTALQIIVTNI